MYCHYYFRVILYTCEKILQEEAVHKGRQKMDSIATAKNGVFTFLTECVFNITTDDSLAYCNISHYVHV